MLFAVMALPVIVGRAVPVTLIATDVAVIVLPRISGVAAFTSEVPPIEIVVPPLTVEFSSVPVLPTRKLSGAPLKVTPSAFNCPSTARLHPPPSRMTPLSSVRVSPTGTVQALTRR